MFASAYMGRKRRAAAPFNVIGTREKTRLRGRIVAHGVKAFEKLRFRPMYAWANIDWIRKKASAILERVLRFGTERLRDQEKPYEDYRM
jgi:hypothetical protein